MTANNRTKIDICKKGIHPRGPLWNQQQIMRMTQIDQIHLLICIIGVIGGKNKLDIPTRSALRN